VDLDRAGPLFIGAAREAVEHIGCGRGKRTLYASPLIVRTCRRSADEGSIRMPAPAPSHRAGRRALAAGAITLALGVLLGSANHADTREDVTPLLSTEKSVLGQTIAYPVGAPAKVTAAIVAMQPGEQTGWHKHDVPMFAYLLEGELTVDYGQEGTRVYRKGEAVMEAIGVAHNGRNTGRSVARVLAVFMGADGVPDTVPMKDGAPAPQ
jgi:quercetin dioxygenase-like cupin family protein